MDVAECCGMEAMMPRVRKSGAIYPIKYETRKRLKDGSVKTYAGWHAKVDGKWVAAKTYKECDAKIAKALKEKVTWGLVSGGSTKLADYAEQWYEGHKDLIDPATRNGYRAMIVHLRNYPSLRVTEVTPSVARRIIKGMRLRDGGDASVGSKKNLYSTLNMVLKAAVADRLIPTNPMDAVERPAGKDPKLVARRPHNSFTDEQLLVMLREASSDIRDGTRQWWRILTGMRQGEILGASLDDLSLFPCEVNGSTMWEGYYTVNWKLEAIRRLHGCGSPDKDGRYPCGYKQGRFCPSGIPDVPVGFDMIPLSGRWFLTRPKSHTGRVVPIIPQLGTVVHRYLEAVKDEPNPYGLIFHRPDGTPIDKNDDIISFRALLSKAGVPSPETRYGHECRNSVVSLLFSMGVDPGKIQRIIGHSSLAMSEYYRRVPKEELFEGMETIGDRLDLKQIEWKA